MLKKAIRSPQSFGPAAHHAAWLLNHTSRIAKYVSSVAPEQLERLEQVLQQAVDAGRRLELLEQAEAKPTRPPQTEEEAAFMAKAVKRRDAETVGLDQANAERAAKIDASRFDELRSARMSFEKIAEAFGVTEPTLRKWRRQHNR